MTLGLHCLAFQEMLREGFTCPNESPLVTVSKLLLAFWIPLSSNTENPGSKHHSCFTHFHLHFLFRTEKHGSQKTAKSCLFATKFLHTGVLCACACVHVGVQTAFQLETHCWISLESRKSLYKTISVRHIGIMLPVICLTSFFCQSPCPAVCHAGRENNLFWAGRAPAWQGQWGQAQGKKQAQEFSDVGSVCLMAPPALNLGFLYLTSGKLLSADTLRHKITPNMGILLGDRNSLETSLLNSRFFW